ncbi:hypothetical protein V6Z11_D13G085800 [Gossypium hirsutum]
MPELSSTLSSHIRFLLQSLTEANADSVFRELCQCRSSTNKTVELVDSKTNGDLSRSKSESMNADENLLCLTRDAQSSFCSRSSTADKKGYSDFCKQTYLLLVMKPGGTRKLLFWLLV